MNGKELLGKAEKLRDKPWTKAVACVLFVVSLTACVISSGRVEWLMARGAYQRSSYDNIITQVEDDLLSDRLSEVGDAYTQYRRGDHSIDINSWSDDENFVFVIRNADGALLTRNEELKDYRARQVLSMTVSEADEMKQFKKYYRTPEERDEALAALEEEYDVTGSQYIDPDTETKEGSMSSTAGYYLEAEYIIPGDEEAISITGFIKSPLTQRGEIYRELAQAKDMYYSQYAYMGLLVGGAAVALLSLGFLVWSTGRRPESEEIALHWMDKKIPTDITAVGGLLLLFIGVGVGMGTSYDMLPIFNMIPTAIAFAFLLMAVLSLVRRWKAKMLKDQMFYRRLLNPMRRAGRWLRVKGKVWGSKIAARGRILRAKVAGLLGKLPLFWGAALGFLLLCILEMALVMCYGFSTDDVFLLLWVMLKIAEAVLAIYIVLALLELQKGGRELAAGNLDYKIPLDKLNWAFKEHGENLTNMRQAIQNAVEVQMKSERMRTELITNVSHDIKTPLTSIVSYVDLLKKQEMPTEEAKEYLDVLERQSARLKKLTEDLVEASKASTGNINVDFQRTDVNVLLTQSAGEYEERLKEKDLTLLLTPAKEAPAISADGRLLWRVFENLLSNIYKYAQPGTRVYLTCEETEETVTIVFRNISADPLNISPDELTERFVRGDASRNTDGSGLGLSIAQSLTQLQKGTFAITIDGDLFKATLTFPRIP